jgi:ferredoxin
LNNFPDVRCTLLYGIRSRDDILFHDELQALQAAWPERLQVHYVCSEPDPGWRGPAGLLSAERIRELTGDLSEKTFFVSGPGEMYDYLDGEMEQLNLSPGRVRKEVRGETTDVSRRPDFPKELAGRVFSVTVGWGDGSVRLPARSMETVLVAMERGALAPPAACRSGECGYCRSRLISGEVYVIAETDGRRQADRSFGYFHPCSSYPLSDLQIDVPSNPVQAEDGTAECCTATRR